MRQKEGMSRLLQTKVGEVRDGEILALIEELEQACPVGSHQFVNQPLLFFLNQCVYPEGPGKRVPLSTKTVALAPLLETRVGKLADGGLRDLCGELAVLSGDGLESFANRKVYVLLNKTLPKHEAPPAPSLAQRRWDAVAGRRRSNR